MNICMLVSNFLPRQGGAEYVVHHLTRALIEARHTVTVLAGADPAARTIRYPYPVHHCPLLPLIGLETQRLWHARYHHARERFDVVHAHIAWEAGCVAARLQRRCGVPVVITPHGGDVQVVPEIEYGLCLNPKIAEKVRFALQNADRITAISQRMRLAIADRSGQVENVRDAGCGTEFHKIQSIRTEDLRPQIGFAPDDFVVLSVGRNSRVKDIGTLLEGFRLAAEKEHRLKLLMVGPDESIRELVNNAGLDKQAVLLGRIPRNYDPKHPTEAVFDTPYPELIAAYRACDVYVSSSLVESFNTAALDAFACGKPVLVTNTQGFMDLLNDGINGWSIPPRDPAALAEKILNLVRNPEACRHMGEAGRRIAAEYDWARVAERYLTVYQEAIANAQSQRGSKPAC
jgi:glycosyltransferase involved in cell wall biosynthesis